VVCASLALAASVTFVESTGARSKASAATAASGRNELVPAS
jgi:hypothetical protein